MADASAALSEPLTAPGEVIFLDAGAPSAAFELGSAEWRQHINDSYAAATFENSERKQHV